MNAWAGLSIISGLSIFSLVFFIALFYADRFSNRRALERAAERGHQEMLLQRIQAPQTAVDQNVIKQAQATQRMAPHFEDDDEFNQAMTGDFIGFDPLAGVE